MWTHNISKINISTKNDYTNHTPQRKTIPQHAEEAKDQEASLGSLDSGTWDCVDPDRASSAHEPAIPAGDYIRSFRTRGISIPAPRAEGMDVDSLERDLEDLRSMHQRVSEILASNVWGPQVGQDPPQVHAHCHARAGLQEHVGTQTWAA